MAHKTKMRLLQLSGALDGNNAAAFEFIDGSGTSNQSYLRFDTVSGQTEFGAPIVIGTDGATAGDIKIANTNNGELIWEGSSADGNENKLRASDGASVNTLPASTGTILTTAAAITVGQGGTGATTLTDGGVLLGSGTDPITALGVMSNGQLLIGDGSTDPQLATLSAGTGVAVSNGAASISVAIGQAVATSDSPTFTDLTLTGGDLAMTSASQYKPVISLTNTHNGAEGATIKLVKDPGDDSPADDDQIGVVIFEGKDSGDVDTTYGQLAVQSADVTGGAEQGDMFLQVAANDGTPTTGLKLAGGASAGVVNVVLGGGAGSTTTVVGNLTVSGTTTTVNSTTMTVDDKNLELGSVDVPDDTTADGGGITLKGATDKTIIWDDSNDNWTSNQDWNIATGKKYKINNAAVFDDATTITSTVTSAAGLVTVSALNAGSITTGFGNIDNGTSNMTSGGVWSIDVDGSAGAAGSLNLGADGDATVYHDGSNLVIATDGAGGGGIILDTEDDTLEIKGSGTVQATFSAAGLDLAAGDVYKIDGTTLLSETALAGTVVVDLPSLDIAGGTDIGEALVDADHLIVYNASATANRKMAMSRLSTFIAAGSTSKAVYVATASVSANNDIQIPGAIVASDWSNAASGSAEVYLNGQLLLSGGLGATNFDYYQSVTAGRADPPGRVKFEFDIEENDVLQFILRS